MIAVRVLLGAVGVAAMGWGAWLLVTTTQPDDVLGLAVWMLGLIVLHDAVLAPLIVAAAFVARRFGARVGWSDLAIVQGAVLTGALLTAVAVSISAKQRIGARNDSVLPLDYDAGLAIAWAAIAVVTVAVLVLRRVIARRRVRTEG